MRTRISAEKAIFIDFVDMPKEVHFFLEAAELVGTGILLVKLVNGMYFN